MVAFRSGVYLRRRASVKPGRGGRNPLRSAVCRVEIAGENSAAWWKVTILAGVHEFPSVGVGPVVFVVVDWSVAVRPCSASM